MKKCHVDRTRQWLLHFIIKKEVLSVILINFKGKLDQSDWESAMLVTLNNVMAE